MAEMVMAVPSSDGRNGGGGPNGMAVPNGMVEMVRRYQMEWLKWYGCIKYCRVTRVAEMVM